MPFDKSKKSSSCTVCKSPANVLHIEFGVGEVVDCSRCGDFHVSHVTVDDIGLPFSEPKRQALASYLIRKLYAAAGQRVDLKRDFFEALKTRTLPTAAEATDNLIIWIANESDGSPGRQIRVDYGDAALLGTLGVVDEETLTWIVDSLQDQRLFSGNDFADTYYFGSLTPQGWHWFEN